MLLNGMLVLAFAFVVLCAVGLTGAFSSNLAWFFAIAAGWMVALWGLCRFVLAGPAERGER